MASDPSLPATEPPLPDDSAGENFGAQFDPPPRILVADDDEMFGGFLVEFFRREGCHCDRVIEGSAAEQQLVGQDYDLLVADIFMPGNSRLELIERIHQSAHDLPVILMTGRPTVETAAKSVRLPVTAYLTKPPDLDDLRKEARQAIQNHRNLRMIARGKARLQDWQAAMTEIELLLRQSSGRHDATPWNRYLALTLQNLLMTLLELKQISENVAVAEALGSNMRQAELLTAVQRTITVLRNTRQHFKSKDLGDLRHELENLIDPGRTTTPPGNSPGPGSGSGSGSSPGPGPSRSPSP